MTLNDLYRTLFAPEPATKAQRHSLYRLGYSSWLTAMMVMIQDLIQTLEQRPMAFLPVEAEKLAWLLGEKAASFPLIDPSALKKGESAGGSRLAKLRHSTVESLAAVVMGQMPDGTTVAVQKQRTRWTNAEPEPQG